MSLEPLYLRFVLGDLDLTSYPFAVPFGADYGAAQNITQVVTSGLDDGQIQVVTGSSNRTLTIPVFVEESDMAALAAAEAALAFECAKDYNELKVDPGDGFGAVTVFATYRPQWAFQRDDTFEQNGYRRYEVLLPAHPFGFSEDEVTDVAVEAPPVSPSTITMASGTSATGWTSAAGVTTDGTNLVVSAGSPVSSFDNYGTPVYQYVVEASFAFSAVDFTATKYVSMDVAFRDSNQSNGGGVNYAYGLAVDGIDQQLVSATYLGNGFTKLTWECNDSSATSLRVRAQFDSTNASGAGLGFKVANVKRSNVVTGLSAATGRQSTRLLPVTGSARTAGSVAVTHPTQGLGDVFIYTCPDLANGYDPDLTAYRSATGSTVTTDATTVSGSYVTANKIFNVNAQTLPAGPYLLMMRAASENELAGATATPIVRSLVGSTEFAEQTLKPVDVSAGFAMSTYVLGVVTLPLTRFPTGSQGSVQIEVNGSFRLDTLWAFYIGDGADLTHVRAGAGTPALGAVHSALFLDAPSLANEGRPGIFVGTKADRSDCFDPGYPAVQSWGRHPLSPPFAWVKLVTTGAVNASMTNRHRPAWFTHAGQ